MSEVGTTDGYALNGRSVTGMMARVDTPDVTGAADSFELVFVGLTPFRLLCFGAISSSFRCEDVSATCSLVCGYVRWCYVRLCHCEGR